ncbi:hypothetical protein EBZ57_03450 [bacterium]|nr:hypothetical protein [bacterium]
MKSLTDYVTENTRTFDFRIRLACEVDDTLIEKIKTVLEAYKIVSITKPKRLPIHESPEFPNLGPVEINIIDVCLSYPTTDALILSKVSERAGMHQSCIKVTPLNGPYEAALAGMEQSNLQKWGESVLATPEMTTTKPPADLVGDARVPVLIKELEATRRYEYSQAAGGKTTATKTSDTFPGDTVSPLGSRQIKLPTIKKISGK